MNETLKETHIQNVAQQRALLAVEGDPFLLESGEIAIRIKNHGRLAATISSYELFYRQHVSYGQSFSRQRRVTPNRVIPAEDAQVIGMRFPRMPQYIPGKGFWEVRGVILVHYDDGFGNTQTLSHCISVDPPSKTWRANCGQIDFIDLSADITHQAQK